MRLPKQERARWIKRRRGIRNRTRHVKRDKVVAYRSPGFVWRYTHSMPAATQKVLRLKKDTQVSTPILQQKNQCKWCLWWVQRQSKRHSGFPFFPEDVAGGTKACLPRALCIALFRTKHMLANLFASSIIQLTFLLSVSAVGFEKG